MRWYVAYSLSLRNLEEFMAERGVEVDHSTVHRWAIRLVPLPEKASWSQNAPDFGTKAADVIGLYLNPSAHAVVFCMDGKTAIQAQDRKDRMLSLSPGRARSHGFEYRRNGTLSLFAALNTATGEVIGKTAPRHTSGQFVAFLTGVIASQRPKQEIHVICDNVSSHKPSRVHDFLRQQRNVQLHYTPTCTSWLNQVENRFARIQRDVITRGIFTTVKASCYTHLVAQGVVRGRTRLLSRT
ncbi:IS630 family transposase [Paraburkholderia humisilvae]|uniref:IS630 family transposase n=1 Tax=Paraburkholderia humisilvae TaxID=627669 RepID=UPI0035E87989